MEEDVLSGDKGRVRVQNIASKQQKIAKTVQLIQNGLRVYEWTSTADISQTKHLISSLPGSSPRSRFNKTPDDFSQGMSKSRYQGYEFTLTSQTTMWPRKDTVITARESHFILQIPIIHSTLSSLK